MKVKELVALYIELRDKRAERKKAYAEADAADKTRQEQIEAKLLEVFNQSGIDSLRTEAGTAYTTTQTAASVADRDIFMSFVKERELWPLIEVRAAKTAIEQYKELNDGELPPGVNWREERVVNIRRS